MIEARDIRRWLAIAIPPGGKQPDSGGLRPQWRTRYPAMATGVYNGIFGAACEHARH